MVEINWVYLSWSIFFFLFKPSFSAIPFFGTSIDLLHIKRKETYYPFLKYLTTIILFCGLIIETECLLNVHFLHIGLKSLAKYFLKSFQTYFLFQIFQTYFCLLFSLFSPSSANLRSTLLFLILPND